MGADKTITVNRKARYDYEILESVEAGIVLTGTEIKSIREGRVNLSDAYARPDGRELWLHNAHIAQYSSGNVNNHEPTRPRKLLLRKEQARELGRQVNEKGLTLVPLKLYLKKGHWAKIEIGLAR
ncbi:MAG: SsrA-binding protein SmpB, partial [Chloroflexi bacterium]|nr:SsrA-binding protein SmpB [Chloroflexota bacterium]